MSIGYDRPLYILPFDHRGTFQKNMFGWSGAITPEQTAKIADMKKVITTASRRWPAASRRTRPASWWTSSSAPRSCRDAAKHGYNTSCPAEKSGQDEFDFEYGEDFAKHIEVFRPTFCKVLVRTIPRANAR